MSKVLLTYFEGIALRWTNSGISVVEVLYYESLHAKIHFNSQTEINGKPWTVKYFYKFQLFYVSNLNNRPCNKTMFYCKNNYALNLKK